MLSDLAGVLAAVVSKNGAAIGFTPSHSRAAAKDCGTVQEKIII